MQRHREKDERLGQAPGDRTGNCEAEGGVFPVGIDGEVEVIFDYQHFPGGVHANYQQLKTLAPEIKAKMTQYHLSDGMLDIDVKADGFAGLMEPVPVGYDF